MWRMQTNFLVFSGRKLDFGKVLCIDAQRLAFHLTSVVGYLSDGIFDPKEFPVMVWVSVFGMGCFEAKCFPKVLHEVWCASSGKICLKLSLFCEKAIKAMQICNLGVFFYHR